MTQLRLTRTTVAVSAGLFIAGLAIGVQAQYDPQGLYSARAIFDAEVHFEAAPASQPSEVVDLLLGDDQRVHAIIVDTHDSVGQDGDTIVFTNQHYRLVNYEEEGETRHDIIVETDAESLKALPRYDQDWLNSARQRAREAWHTAGEGTESAWHQTQKGLERIGEGAETAWERAQEGAERAGRRISETLDDWTSENGN
ncbi:hypothetical protein HNO52_04650 [Billgrantia diversa]|uniref:hypothetical protein n=1 Tax=Halomonas sp. MCCC 1A13316 TaxID=2733487 RepID=UPI0018A66E78|nr:hypothetical protein [Halomonas sp. MCCC 1A13316]QOR37870.1 hypothetical protein HNO52_04650 [Halomonas sp. MCCC 1A13316]